jgi:hypothetical protein
MKLVPTALLCLLLCGCVFVPVDGPKSAGGDGTTTVCHKGKKTMELPEGAARAHLDHGDRLGPC